MTPWFDPLQLIRTGIRTVVSAAFGREADARLVEAALPGPADTPVCDYSALDELWIDYIADTGDGWDSTYHVAWCAAQPVLALDGLAEPLRRGRLLVLGGDQVYPTASREDYDRKLVAPFETALPAGCFPDAAPGEDHPQRPHVFAVPGNHDWYDGLAAFRRLFCTTRAIGGWRTRQTRSYFACRLPHDWWLLGIDVQLESDIDAPQIEYFRRVARLMDDGAKVIVCLAEPHWIYAARYARMSRRLREENNERLLWFFEQHVIGRRVAAWIAGDVHHYRRHEQDGTAIQKITCGGGGAFLDDTAADATKAEVIPDGTADATTDPDPPPFRKRREFPPIPVARRLVWRNLLFPIANPTFGVATGALYALLAWSIKLDFTKLDTASFGEIVRASLTGILSSQLSVAYGLLVVLGFYAFTDTHSRRYKAIAGPLHGLAHLLAALVVTWLGVRLFIEPYSEPGIAAMLGVLAVVALGGYLAGGILMGLYLLISCVGFGRQADHAFSALHCPDWKSFLRMRVARSGVTIHAIGLPTVSTDWVERRPDATSPSFLAPAHPRRVRPVLIEPPIRVPDIARPLRPVKLTQGCPSATREAAVRVPPDLTVSPADGTLRSIP